MTFLTSLADFELDALKPIECDRNAMEKVIFDDTKKAILKTLVENQRLTAQNQDGRKPQSPHKSLICG